MGFFSWITSDTHESISNAYSDRGALPVYLYCPDGTKIYEPDYQGYGDFGGHDAYALLALLMPVFDMPLRFLSGISSVEILNLFGADAKLAFFKDADKFILLFGGKTFEVAQQCNGFGLMVSCAILSILLSVPDLGRTALSKAAHVILCILLAYAANIFRILCIVLTSPHIADKNYHIMHESYGYLFFMLALIATWKICMPRKNPSSGR